MSLASRNCQKNALPRAAIFALAFALVISGAPGSAAFAQGASSAPSTSAGRRAMSPRTDLGILPKIEWSRSYRKVGTLDYILTGIGATASAVTRIIGPPENGPRGGVWFDEDVRDSLRASGSRNRLLAADMSDVLLGVTSSYGLFLDPLVNATWLRASPEVGTQLFWINAEVIALTLGAQQATANVLGRERPYGRTCGTSEIDERAHACRGNDRYRSFFSGHTSVPFSVAAATCVNHLYLPLSGKRAWIACSVGFVTAATSGTLRIVSDNHYATDVITGVLVGTGVGFAVPLLHYVVGVPTPRASLGPVEIVLLPMVQSERRGATVGFSATGILP